MNVAAVPQVTKVPLFGLQAALPPPVSIPMGTPTRLASMMSTPKTESLAISEPATASGPISGSG